MTTFVTPIRPFRAWQYRKDSTEPVPEWASVSVRNNEANLPYMDDMWLVEDRWYTPAEFQERFRIVQSEAEATAVRGYFKAVCCKCGRVDWRDEPAAGVYFCSYGCT
jgi:hypothetical protein